MRCGTPVITAPPGSLGTEFAAPTNAGEPSGSAGAPILAAIEGAGLVDCVVVVSRYFGGSKLGVGGLIRAYGAAAAEATRAAPRKVGTPAARLRVRYPYEHTAPVMRILEQVNAAGIEHGYAADGAHGEVRFALPLALEPLARESLRDATGGSGDGRADRRSGAVPGGPTRRLA